MKINNKTTVKKYLKMQRNRFLKVDLIKDVLRKVSLPDKFNGKDVHKTIEGITLSKIKQLESLSNPNFLDVIEILFDIDKKKLQKERVLILLAFVDKFENVMLTLSQITKMSEVDYESEEIRAGIHDLNFGLFGGVIDAFHRRSPIYTHNDIVEKVPAKIIYQCLANDAKLQAYERRLKKIIQKS